MATLQAADIADLVVGTLKELGRMKFQQIAQNLQDYEVMQRWLKRDRVTFDSGYGIQRTIMHKLSGAARHLGLFEEDNVNVVDVLTQLNVPWRHATTAWAFERRELLMNKGKALIVKIVQPRRVAAMLDLVEELENKAWASPGGSNVTDPYGIPYFVVKNATAGFNGGNPSGHSACAGINSTTITKWKNYTGTYTDVSKADLIKSLRTAYRKIGFKSPVDVPDFRKGRGDLYRLYMNLTTISAFEDLAEAQNENLGRDLASMDGVTAFRRNPVLWVSKLDSDTQNPVYMINHSVWYPVVLAGDYLEETGPKEAAKQHNVYEVFVDLSYNYLCVDRRRQAVLYAA